jgi:ubiquinone/menaquinone biosynthesis C-methylase UbiE
MKGIIMSDSQQQDASQDVATQAKLQLIKSRFGAVAASYVTSNVHANGQDLSWIVEAAALTGTERVLDIATGGGHVAFALAPHAAEVVALDLTREMLEVAEQEAIKRQLTTISFLEGDARQLPCADASFDLVVCRQAAHHFPQIRQCVQEWARVLKPGGKLLLDDTISPADPETDALLHEIEILRDPSHVRSQSLSAWRFLLHEAGLAVQAEREWGIVLDIPAWTQRMRTPAASVEAIEQLLSHASPIERELLHIEVQDGVFVFALPALLITAVKSE